MKLTDQDVQEYKRVHEEEFGELISDDEAREIATRVIQLYEILIQPLPDENTTADIRELTT
jgi:flagellin-specific chaperone FliS